MGPRKPAGARRAGISRRQGLGRGDREVPPQVCMRSNRRSSYEQWDLDLPAALSNEARLGLPALAAETQKGAARFADGKGRGGDFGNI